MHVCICIGLLILTKCNIWIQNPGHTINKTTYLMWSSGVQVYFVFSLGHQVAQLNACHSFPQSTHNKSQFWSGKLCPRKTVQGVWWFNYIKYITIIYKVIVRCRKNDYKTNFNYISLKPFMICWTRTCLPEHSFAPLCTQGHWSINSNYNSRMFRHPPLRITL